MGRKIAAQRRIGRKSTLIRENELLRADLLFFRIAAAHSNCGVYCYDMEARTVRFCGGNAAPDGKFSLNLTLPDTAAARSAIVPESFCDYKKLFDDIHDGKRAGSAQICIRLPEGGAGWMNVKYTLVDSGDGKAKTAVISLEDVTGFREKELACEFYRQIIGSDSDTKRMFVETDVTADLLEKRGGGMLPLWFSPGGCLRSDLVSCIAGHCVSLEDGKRYRSVYSSERLLAFFAGGGRSLREEWRLLLSAGDVRWICQETQLILDRYSRHVMSVSIFRDITEEKNAVLRIRRQAETDGMTGLYNKATTEVLIKERLAKKSGLACALLIVDLDGLKRINDSLGHAMGDRAIKTLARTLRSQFRRTDVIGRIGGDEFMVFLDGADSEEKLRGAVAHLLRKLALVPLNGKDEVCLQGSAGAVLGIVGETTFEELYQKADMALYYVKHNGKNGYAFYDPEMECTASHGTGRGASSLG